MQDLHDREFKKTDCLKCANCCKTTGPLFTIADVERISKHFRQKPQQFIDQYLRIDEENDYVLKSVPCTFLDAENYCMIYDVRPKACREFPHTDRKKFQQISNLTLQNVAICPAAYNIVEEMKKKMPLQIYLQNKLKLMKRSKILFLLFLIALSLSLLGIFADQDVIVSSTFTKIMEVAIMTLLLFVILVVFYWIFAKTLSRVKKMKTNQNKKDLTQ